MGKASTRVGVGYFDRAGLCSLVALFAVALVFTGCGAPTTAVPRRSQKPIESREQPSKAPQHSVAESVQQAFGTWQVIGEGSRFVTVKVDLARELEHGAEISALLLDKGHAPLRHITGFAFRPEIPARSHLWFFFFIYAPAEIPHQMRESAFIKFSYTNNRGVKVEKSVAHKKSWQIEGEAEIFDLPAPPAEVEGVMVLKDYAFFASGDLRKPDGYYVEGKVIGDRGSYTRFEVMSQIKGEEPKPELTLEAQRGWLELSTGATHATQEAVAPIPPYVNGWWDGKGYFHPDPLVIY